MAAMVAIEGIDIILTIDLFIHRRNSREIRDIARVVHGCLRVKSDRNQIASGNTASCQETSPRISWSVESRWIIAPTEELRNGPISWREICGSECIARLLMRKGFSSAEEVESFLHPRLKSLSDPFLLPNMQAAVERLLAALDRHERIVLFGDYDVDGVTSIALLAEMLRAYGANPQLFLPLRMEEGYGLSRESVERCLDRHRPQLLVAVDCATSS